MKKILLILTTLAALVAIFWICSFFHRFAYTYRTPQWVYSFYTTPKAIYYDKFGTIPEVDILVESSIPFWALEASLLAAAAPLFIVLYLKRRRNSAQGFPVNPK